MTNLGKYYENEIAKAATIDELVWIDTEYKPDHRLPVTDLVILCRHSKSKRAELEATGQRYHRATEPTWRKNGGEKSRCKW